jgi:hypothetical protein
MPNARKRIDVFDNAISEERREDTAWAANPWVISFKQIEACAALFRRNNKVEMREKCLPSCPVEPAPPARRSRSTKTEVAEKKNRLVSAVMETGVVRQAATMVGMSAPQAYAAMRSNEVRQALAGARAEIESVSTLRRCDVLALFLEGIDMARALGDPANVISGADKIAKMMGYYAPEVHRLELSASGRVLAGRLRDASDEDLVEIVAGRGHILDAPAPDRTVASE